MGNIYEILFSEVNLVLTVLLIILLLYWVVSMIGGIDFDVDFDVEVDLDPAIDAGTAIDGGNMDFQDLSNAELIRKMWWEKDAVRSNGGRFSLSTSTLWVFPSCSPLPAGSSYGGS